MNQNLYLGSNTTFLLRLLRQRCFYAIIVFIAIYPTCVVAQADNAETYRRWELSFHAGFATSGPANEVEDLMKMGGFSENDGFLPGQGKDHPYSLTGLNFQKGAPWVVGLYYSFKPFFAAGVIFSDTKIGTTWGYRKPVSMNINYNTTVVAPVVAIQLWDVIRLGAGPAKYNPKTNTDAFSAEDGGEIASKTGFLIDFGFAIPAKGQFFVQLKMQYRSIGVVEIGPFNSQSLKFSSTLPATKVNYDHWFIGLGFGFGR